MHKTPSPTPWQTRLIAAEGYLELGMLDDASGELDALCPDDQDRPEVLGFRVNHFMADRRWEEGAELAGRLVEIQPDCVQWWISYGFCVRRAESVEKAETILREGLARHPKEAMLHFNLACYACVTGRIPEARDL